MLDCFCIDAETRGGGPIEKRGGPPPKKGGLGYDFFVGVTM